MIMASRTESAPAKLNFAHILDRWPLTVLREQLWHRDISRAGSDSKRSSAMLRLAGVRRGREGESGVKYFGIVVVNVCTRAVSAGYRFAVRGCCASRSP